jgi:CMP-N,N'-diacetyllegionaminic acid synthase
MEIKAIIGARGGSKGIKNKNIVDLGGFPLIAYSIVASIRSGLDTYVSTDNKEIADIAEEYGAKIIVRPEEYATDASPDIDFIKHALKKIKADYLVHLRPTTPFRDPNTINRAIEEMIDSNADSMRSAHRVVETPYKYFKIKKGYFKPLLGSLENSNLPRQLYEPAYHPNGYVDILDTSRINKTIHGNKILPFITDEVIEIDREIDLDYAKSIVFKTKIYGLIKQRY